MNITLVFYALALTILQYIFEIIILDFTSLCKGKKKEWLRKIEEDLLLLITALGPCMSAACTFFLAIYFIPECLSGIVQEFRQAKNTDLKVFWDIKMMMCVL